MEGMGQRTKLTTWGAQGSSSGVAVPNPRIKWAEQNTHSDRPPSAPFPASTAW